jgi:hypothetical protein
MSAVRLNTAKLGLLQNNLGQEEQKILSAVNRWKEEFAKGGPAVRVKLADLICDGLRLAADLRAARTAQIAVQRYSLANGVCAA